MIVDQNHQRIGLQPKVGRESARCDVFISYSSDNKTVADAICATLERSKIRCWIAPRDLLPGPSYGESIINGIKASRMMVVVLSASSNGSPQVLREVERAVYKGIPIVPFRIENIKPSGSMEFFLSAPHWLDALTKPLENHINRLVTVVQAVLDPEVQEPIKDPKVDPKKPAKSAVFAVLSKLVLMGRLGFDWLRRQFLKLSLRQRFGVTGVGVAVLVPTMFWMGTRPGSLDDDYRQYKKAIHYGRGSVSFLTTAAPSRYDAWLSLADSGDPVAELFVGRCYQEGLVVEEDKAAAVNWLQKSAAKRNEYAMLTLGLAYEQGEGVAENLPTAVRWYTQAAELGNVAAMRALGFINSKAGSQNKPEIAFQWFRKAADAGDPDAMRIVGNLYLTGTGTKLDKAESERWYKKAIEAGNPELVGKSFGDRLATHFAAYLAPGAGDATKASSLAAIRNLLPDYQKLELIEVSTIFSLSDLPPATNSLSDLPKDDPLRKIHDDMVVRYANLYAESSKSQRTSSINDFTKASETLVRQWYLDELHDKVIQNWERLFHDIPLDKLNRSGEVDSLIRHVNWAVSSMYRVGKRKEAAEILESALKLCDLTLKDRPWDWYAKNAYSGLCFDSAEVLIEIGDRAEAQPLLKRGWAVRLKQYGKESLLDRYSSWPLLGKVPDDATTEDREFFERFAKNSGDSKKSNMKRFTINCDFAGKKFPFFVYIITGSRGYAELQDQFRWVKESRGGEIPDEVRASFLRLNKIAVENNVDFMELCVYALGEKAKEDDAKK